MYGGWRKLIRCNAPKMIVGLFWGHSGAVLSYTLWYMGYNEQSLHRALICWSRPLSSWYCVVLDTFIWCSYEEWPTVQCDIKVWLAYIQHLVGRVSVPGWLERRNNAKLLKGGGCDGGLGLRVCDFDTDLTTFHVPSPTNTQHCCLLNMTFVFP